MMGRPRTRQNNQRMMDVWRLEKNTKRNRYKSSKREKWREIRHKSKKN